MRQEIAAHSARAPDAAPSLTYGGIAIASTPVERALQDLAGRRRMVNTYLKHVKPASCSVYEWQELEQEVRAHYFHTCGHRLNCYKDSAVAYGLTPLQLPRPGRPHRIRTL